MWTGLAGVTGLLVHAEVTAPALPEGVHARLGLVYGEHGGARLKLDAYLPVSPAPAGGRPALVVLHGGGWRGGSRGEFGREMARFARHGLAVFAVDYTLSRPGRPSWPANRENTRAAVRWVRRHAAEFEVDPERIAALGASAGGHLAVLLGVDPGDDEARVRAVVSLYAPTDLATLNDACLAPGGPVDLLLGGSPSRYPERAAAASPLTYVNSETPPMLLVHGLEDAQVEPDQSRRFAAALGRAGVSRRLILIEGATHGFGLTVMDRDLLPEILAFLEDTWNHERQLR